MKFASAETAIKNLFKNGEALKQALEVQSSQNLFAI